VLCTYSPAHLWFMMNMSDVMHIYELKGIIPITFYKYDVYKTL
jgi:hypothetical protein